MAEIEDRRWLPSDYAREIEAAAERAVRVGAREPLRYIGIGMTGIVFCDARNLAYKVARTEVSARTIAEEAEWFSIASTVPEIRNRVARFINYHPRQAVLERECVRDDPRTYRTKDDRWEFHQKLGAVMEKYGFSSPEFKEDSYRYVRGRGWVLVDASMPSRVGTRLIALASRVLSGERVPEGDPQDLAFAVRMESGRTIDPARAKRLSDRLEALAATTSRVEGRSSGTARLSLLFHGTRRAITELRPSTGGEFGPGVYLTKSRDTARFYARSVAQGPDAPRILVVEVDLRNPIRIDKVDWIRATENRTPRTVQRALMRKGHDAIVGVAINGVDEQIVVFDPARVRVLGEELL